MLKWQPTAVALAVGLCFSSGVFAQSSEGYVYGRAASGATVTLTAIDTGSTRTTSVDPEGSFNFSKLPPGRYRLSVGGQTREVSVAIGSGTEVSFVESQRIEVTGSRVRSSIDVNSVESNSVFSQEQILALPVARNVDAIALLAPGAVKGDNFNNGNKDSENNLALPSIDGASVAENGYYINGLDVTNIRNFLAYANLPFGAVAQQQVKNGGYGAEYGRSLGGVVSIVTKRGTNEWKGGGSFSWEPRGLRQPGRDVLDLEPTRLGLPAVFNSADQFDNQSATIYAGGPIIKDKLFVFGLLEGKNDSVDIYNQSTSWRRRDTQPNGLVKLDYLLTDQHQFEFTGITTKKKFAYADYTSATPYSPKHDGAPGNSDATGGGRVWMAKYTGYLTDDLTVSALIGRVTDKRLDFSGYRREGLDCPVVLDVDLSEIGCWVGPFPGEGDKDPTAPDDEDKRKSYRVDLEYNLGKHTIRAGIDNQVFNSSEAGGSSYTGGAYWRYNEVGSDGKINGVDGFAPGTPYVRKRILQSTSGTYEVKNSAFYIEDSWKVTKDLLLYGGLRWESFENANGDGVTFVDRKNLRAPRAGFSWDLSGNGTLKVFGNYGRYYIPVASNSNIRMTRSELFTHEFFTYSTRDPRTQAPVSLTSEAIGGTVILEDGSLPDPGTVADTKLKPMNQDEYILGFQKALTKDLTVGAKVTYRKVNDGMDDYCGRFPVAQWAADNGYTNFDYHTMASCALMNPGRPLNLKIDAQNDGVLVPVTIPNSYLRLAKYERTYKALELTMERPWDGKWSLQGSYTLSASRGTAEGYVQSNLDQDDAGVTQDFDWGSFSDGAKGPLPNDRKHVIKLFGNYQLSQEFRLGFNVTVASGRPLSCIGYVPPSVFDYGDNDDGSGTYSSASAYYCIKDPTKPAVLVQRGSVGRTPWTRSLDLSLAYIPQWANGRLTLQADVFNLLNSQKATELDETRDYSRADSNGSPPYRVNQNYLRPTSFQEPRYVRLTARYEF